MIKKARIFKVFMVIICIALSFPSMLGAQQAHIWDEGARDWVPGLTAGDPIDVGVNQSVTDLSNAASDSEGYIYSSFVQSDGSTSHLYFSRYDPVNNRMMLWNSSISAWTSTFANATPIGTGVAAMDVSDSALAVSSNDDVYIAFVQESTNNENHILMSHYDKSAGTVKIWDHSTSNWSSTFSTGEPVDTAVSGDPASSPSIAIDANNFVYVAYVQEDVVNNENHIHLTRYDITNTQMKIWDHSASDWTSTLANGEPIDTAVATRIASNPVIKIHASTGDAYIAYIQDIATGQDHLHLTRYDKSTNAVEVWDHSLTTWTSTLANGEAIDTAVAGDLATSVDPAMAISSANNMVYIAYIQDDVVNAEDHVHLTRYAIGSTAVQIWDHGGTTWTATLANGDPIDNGMAGRTASTPSIGITSNADLWIAYVQDDATNNEDHIHLTTYDDSTNFMGIWDHSATAFTATLANGEPIDTAIAGKLSSSPEVIISEDGTVYIAYIQDISSASNTDHVHLTRYIPSTGALAIWDQDLAYAFSTTLANGDPIDTTTATYAASALSLATYDNRLYVPFIQNNGSANHLYMSSIRPFAATGSPLNSDSGGNRCLLNSFNYESAFFMSVFVLALAILCIFDVTFLKRS